MFGNIIIMSPNTCFTGGKIKKILAVLLSYLEVVHLLRETNLRVFNTNVKYLSLDRVEVPQRIDGSIHVRHNVVFFVVEAPEQM